MPGGGQAEPPAGGEVKRAADTHDSRQPASGGLGCRQAFLQRPGDIHLPPAGDKQQAGGIDAQSHHAWSVGVAMVHRHGDGRCPQHITGRAPAEQGKQQRHGAGGVGAGGAPLVQRIGCQSAGEQAVDGRFAPAPGRRAVGFQRQRSPLQGGNPRLECR